MSDPPPSEVNAEYSRIRELLLGSERREIENANERMGEIETIYKRIQSRLEELDESKQWMDRRLRRIERDEDFVNRALPGALKLRNQSEEDQSALVDELKPEFEACLQRSVADDRMKVARTIAPAVDIILESRKGGFNRAMKEFMSDSAFGKGLRKRPWLAWFVPIVLALALAACVVISVLGNIKWNEAMAALRDEAGIEVIDAKNPFFGEKVVAGLRDPKAADPAAILKEAGIDVSNVTVRFAEYHSLNTTFAEERKAENAKRLGDLRMEFVESFGGMVTSVEKVRRRDLETMTKAVFQLRFPEAAKTADIYLDDDEWHLNGNLAEPLYSEVLAELPKLILTGEVNSDNLANSSEARLAKVREDINATTFIFLSGDDELSEDGLRQSDRFTSLVQENMGVEKDLGIEPAKFEVHALPIQGDAEGNRKMEALRIRKIEELLKAAGVSEENILPGVHDTKEQEGRVGVYTTIITGDSPSDE